jgi:hypothetical protein
MSLNACKKNNRPGNDCFPGAATVRQIVNKQATIKLMATINPVYIVEDGAIDTKLIPCNFPIEFYENDLRVTTSGEVKATPQTAFGPCCTENYEMRKTPVWP